MIQSPVISTSRANFRLKVAKTTEEIEEMRELWQKWQTHPDNDIDNFLLLLKSRKEILRPNVILLSREDEPTALIVCRLETSRVNFSLGYKTVRGPSITSLTIPYEGFLGRLDEDTACACLDSLLRQATVERVDRIAFHFVPESSPLLKVVGDSEGGSFHAVYEEWADHWRTHLTPDVDAFWAKLSRKHRMFLRRVSKNLEILHPGKVRYSCVSGEADLADAAVELEKIASKTYLRGLRRGFIADADHVERLKISARNGRLRAFLLHIAGEPVSYAVGPVYDGRYSLAYTAYDPAFKEHDVGQLIVMHAIEALSREGVRQFDFGFGTALYKERFGDTKTRERSVYLYTNSARGKLLVFALKASAATTSLTRRALDKTGFVAFLKRVWRKRLAKEQLAKSAEKAKTEEND